MFSDKELLLKLVKPQNIYIFNFTEFKLIICTIKTACGFVAQGWRKLRTQRFRSCNLQMMYPDLNVLDKYHIIKTKVLVFLVCTELYLWVYLWL
jgi:hypothetical protein